MAVIDLDEWLTLQSSPSVIWFVKRLSANDTLANGTHQAGPHISKSFLFQIFPSIDTREVLNPDVRFPLYVDSHPDVREVRAIYYNNRYHGNPQSGRNEARVTGFGGQTSALLDPESTGAIAIFAFDRKDMSTPDCHVWVCRDELEEDLVEDLVGPVEPGKHFVWSNGSSSLHDKMRRPCSLSESEIPASWLSSFPSGREIVRMSVERTKLSAQSVDKRLTARRDCEYEIFRSVEAAFELPNIRRGFSTIDEFTDRAQTVLQRRKSRSGRSLELQFREILLEEHFVEGESFSWQQRTEGSKTPDFVFPSIGAYHNVLFPPSRLTMLAVKTTCKDRWRQILNEADKIPSKHLLTLQEGISNSQFVEMRNANVQLVVPAKLHIKFPPEVRLHLLTLESFLADIRLLQA